MNAVGGIGKTPAFCGSAPVLTSIKHGRAPAAAFHLARQRLGETRPVDGPR